MSCNGIKIKINGKEYLIEYSRGTNHHVVGLNSRPFEAIKQGSKKIEVRTNTKYSPFDYSKLKEGDIIEFLNESSGEVINTKILGIRKYQSTRNLLETEGTRNVLSSKGNLEQGITNINNLTGYMESIPLYGIYAIEIALIH